MRKLLIALALVHCFWIVAQADEQAVPQSTPQAAAPAAAAPGAVPMPVPAQAPALAPADRAGRRVITFPHPVSVEELRAAGIKVMPGRHAMAAGSVPTFPPMAVPAPLYAPAPSVVPEAPATRLDHLRAALKELETADANGAADAVREEIAREEQSAARQLEKKLAELAVLQAEIDRLRRETKSDKQVLVKIKVIDVDVTKLRSLGFNFRVPNGDEKDSSFQNLVEQLTGKTDGPATQPCVLPNGHALLALFDMLEKQELATIACEPNLTGYSGRPASFLSGGQFPAPTGPDMRTVTMKSYGTKIDFTPQLKAEGRLQIDLALSLSSLDMKHAATLADGTKIPALHVNEMNASFECNAGDTFLFAGIGEVRKIDSAWYIFGQKVGADSEHLVRRFVLVTPQLVDPLDAAPASCPVPHTAEAPASHSR